MTLIRGLPSHTFAPTANQGRLMFCACPELNSRYLDPDQLRGLLCPARMRTAESLCAYVWTNHRPSRLTALENGGQMDLLLDPVIVVFVSTGQAKSSEKSEDLLAMVKKLQKEGSLEPQIEDLINRINELQQAKKKASEELGEALALWEALHRELDSLNGEKVHLEEVLSKKQETLRILQLHCHKKESEVQRLDVKEQLEELMGQHKDLWEFHMLEQRLVREIGALESSKAQLLTEEMLVQAKLEEVGRRLRSQPEVAGTPPVSDGPLLNRPEATAVGMKVELEKFKGQALAEAQSAPEEEAGKGDGEGAEEESRTRVGCRPRCREPVQQPDSHSPQGSRLLGAALEQKDLEPRAELALTPP
ncbi:synaptonemal complex central element protein 1-like [Elephas maximus indicus]|uniref:synaptonemal complex central element protein 1-like n=1 Tax=Elephas maximus indicus TaxID=99487 RepID=UPI002115F084|nr:synaptonemal complex central element protein 1-like [Elephas maximus indicus]